MDLISDPDALYDAFKKAKSGSDWKESVIRYWYGIWWNILNTQADLNNGSYRQKDFVEFDISERGKHRHIKSIHISDRVVQRSLCDNVLMPRTQPLLIYDNGASQENKGIDFTQDRAKRHLHEYHRKYGDNKGFVVTVDYHNYFGSISHEKLKAAYRKIIPEDDIFRIVCYLIDINGGEYGCGIGAQLSQNAGIFYRNPVDQYFKTVKGCKFYDVYMDDTLHLCRTRDEAEQFLKEFREQSALLELQLSEKKTQIHRLEDGFTFLKVRYVLTETGKVVTYQKNDTFLRERRRLKKFKKMGMPGERAADCYRSWRGTVKRFKSNYYRVKRMDTLFEELFPGVEYRTKKEIKNDNQRLCRKQIDKAGRVAETDGTPDSVER